MSVRGFTLLELSVVITCSSIIVPAAYLVERTFERHERRAEAELNAAAGARSVSEELRRDLWLMKWKDDVSLTLVGRGACKELSYVLRDSTLFREGGKGCGDPRAIAAGVSAVSRSEAGIALVFGRATAADEIWTTPFLIGASAPVEKEKR